MPPSKAECYGGDYEGSDGNQRQACGDGTNGLSTGHVGWRIGSERVREVKLVKFNGLNINEVNPVAPSIGREKKYKVSERQFREDPKAWDMATEE